MTDSNFIPSIAFIVLLLTLMFSGYAAYREYQDRPQYDYVTKIVQTSRMSGHYGVNNYLCEDDVWVSEINGETLFMPYDSYSEPKHCIITVKVPR